MEAKQIPGVLARATIRDCSLCVLHSALRHWGARPSLKAGCETDLTQDGGLTLEALQVPGEKLRVFDFIEIRPGCVFMRSIGFFRN